MEIRPLDSWEEYRACERLQREVWGSDFREIAPASLLKVARRLGGVASGAFPDGDGPGEGPGDGGRELAGFVFGLTGFEDGRRVHWSHMLAVRKGRRGEGIGRRLKEHQRRQLLERDVSVVYWTFDPLVATNAHFNLNRLGVRVVDYVPQMYGETESELHRGIGTDRFVVAWDLEAYEPSGASAPSPGGDAASRGDGTPPRDVAAARERAGSDGGPGAPGPEPADPGQGPRPSPAEEAPPVVRIDVPADILDVRRRDPGAAARWRERTRGAFVSRLGSGYRVTGFVPGPERGHYLLTRADVGEEAGQPPSTPEG